MVTAHRFRYCRGCERVQSSGNHHSTCRATDPAAPTSTLQARVFLLLMPAFPSRDLNPELLSRVHLAPLPFYPRTDRGRSCRALGGCGKSALEVCIAHFPTRGMRNNEGVGQRWGESSNHKRAYSGDKMSKGDFGKGEDWEDFATMNLNILETQRTRRRRRKRTSE